MQNNLNTYIERLYDESIEEGKDSLERKIIEQINTQINNLPDIPNKILISEIAKGILFTPNIDTDKKELKQMTITVGLKMKVLGLKTEASSGNLRVFFVDKHKVILEGLYARYLPGIIPRWKQNPSEWKQKTPEQKPWSQWTCFSSDGIPNGGHCSDCCSHIKMLEYLEANGYDKEGNKKPVQKTEDGWVIPDLTEL